MFPTTYANLRFSLPEPSSALFIATAQQTPDHLQRITPVRQKPALLGPLAGIDGQSASKLALPGFTQLLEPVDTTVTQSLIDIATRQPALTQLFTDTLRPVTGARLVGNETFQIARLGQQALFCKPLQSSLDKLLGSAALAQLAHQLDTPMFTSRQQIHGRSPNGERVIQYNAHALIT